ncbi:MAG: sigma-54 dependent transcriptional regulator [Acidobacteriota bacterium]
MKTAGTVWIAEDEEPSRVAMVRALERSGHVVEAFATGTEALVAIRSRDLPDVVITDLRMPGASGTDVLRAVKEKDPEAGVVLVTAFASVESAVEAMKIGSDDYLVKPFDLDELRLKVGKLIERRGLKQEIWQLQGRLDEKFGLSQIVGGAPAMARLFEKIKLVAGTKSTVLITGESGTGKELIANALHQLSSRKNGPFVPVNCSAIQATVLESELFGHERGAFTGAVGRKLGKFELAHGGTLFLDEIGETPLDFQVKLLRFLETRELSRVGGTEIIHVDARLIAATNVDLEAAVADGSFRKDLYFRLKVVSLHVPSLRERPADIPLLTAHFIGRFSKEHEVAAIAFTPAAQQALSRYSWPGNVRELKNMIESFVVLRPGATLDLQDLPVEVSSAPIPAATGFSVGMSMDDVERHAIMETLESTQGNRSRAAEILGIGLRTLQRKLKEYKARGVYKDDREE